MTANLARWCSGEVPRTHFCLGGFVEGEERSPMVVMVSRTEAYGGRNPSSKAAVWFLRSTHPSPVSCDSHVGFEEEDERKTMVVVAHRFSACGGRKMKEKVAVW